MKILEYPFDNAEIIKKKRGIRRELLSSDRPRDRKKITILGGSTTHEIKEILELFLLDQGIEPSFYESEYGRFWEDAMFDNPGLHDFAPDIIFIHTTYRNIKELPETGDDAGTIESKLTTQYQRFEQMWDSLRDRYNCPIIQNNFERPYFRLMGNMDISDIHGSTNFVIRLNNKFYEYANKHSDFYIHDIDYLAGRYGYADWSDIKAWNMYKYALNVNAIPEFAFNLSNIIKSIFGKNKKALVLDLDNTLWGGVIGEDGVEGIAIGPEIPLGEIYLEFQEYIRKHKSLGVMLNISSKNDMDNALAGLGHPDGALNADDFICIKADWNDKDKNIAEIIETLNIMPDSVVFLDDNPAERLIAEAQIEGLTAPAIGNIEDYIRVIDRSGFFEVSGLSSDDLSRNEMYKQNVQRASMSATFADYGDYLRSLDMTATIRDFDQVSIGRIAQLTNKSNQFNLTTKRYTESEMNELCARPDYIRLYGRLADRFGDNGIVSIVTGRQKGSELDIDLWLMSCRVLKRDMECAMLDSLVEECGKRGISKLRGYYYPTSKNSMVKDFYGRMQFELVSRDEQGSSVWELDITNYNKHNNTIRVVA